jgi:hypothetical protein
MARGCVAVGAQRICSRSSSRLLGVRDMGKTVVQELRDMVEMALPHQLVVVKHIPS